MTDHLALDRDSDLSDLAYSLSFSLGLPPMASTAVAEHVFQAIVERFYATGHCYLPNIGWIVFDAGEAVLVPCQAFEATLLKLSQALSSGSFSFAGIESVLEAARRANALSNSETC